MSRWDVSPDKSLSDLFAEWRKAIAVQVDPGTVEMYRLHCAHLERHFCNAPHAVTKANISNYTRVRLAKVKRKTLQKERCTLRSFLAWASEQGHCTELPDMGALPRRAIGTPYHQRRRGKATEVSPEDCRRVIAALPQWSQPRAGKPAFPVRARFIVAFETALRPKTLDAIRVPEHYVPGGEYLNISDEIDKARFGRRLPLSKMAREALDAVAKEGLIFGRHDYRNHLEAAAEKALTPEQARTFCAYDFRHARATQLAGKGDLPTLAYLLGHKHVSTTNLYIHPTLRDAKALLDEVGGGPTRQSGGLVGRTETRQLLPSDMVVVRRSGVEPERPFGHQNLNLGPDGRNLPSHPGPLRERCKALLRAIKANIAVSPAEVNQLARDIMCVTPSGRLCLDIIDGGPWMGRAAVELAWLIIDDAYLEDLTELARRHFERHPEDYPGGLTLDDYVQAAAKKGLL